VGEQEEFPTQSGVPGDFFRLGRIARETKGFARIVQKRFCIVDWVAPRELIKTAHYQANVLDN